MVFVDTSHVLARLDTGDVNHEKAVQRSEEYRDYTLVTTTAVLLEVGDALSRRNRTDAHATIMDFVLSDNTLVEALTEERFALALTLYVQYADKSWGLTDCVSFVVMGEFGLREALTYDQHFTQAGFVALLRTG